MHLDRLPSSENSIKSSGRSELKLRPDLSLARGAPSHYPRVCLNYLARTLRPLGFPERALVPSDAAIAEARRMSHRNSLALPLFFGGVLPQILGDLEGVRAHCAELTRIAGEAGFRFWQAGATILHGWPLAEARSPEAGHGRSGAASRSGVRRARSTCSPTSWCSSPEPS